MYNYTVFFTKANYNPNKSYYANQNRYCGSESFKTEQEAREFAVKVNGTVYHNGSRI